MTDPAKTVDQNILPVQAYFNLDGTFNTFIGQGQPFVISATESISINNSSVNATLYPTFTSATSGQVTGLAITSSSLTWNPSTGVFSAPTFYGTLNGTSNTANSIANGAQGQLVYQSAPGVSAFVPVGSTGQFLLSNGTSAPSWATVATSVTIADQTTDTATYYPLFYSATSGSTNTVETSSTKLQYQPSTGKFTATLFSGSGASLTNIPNGALTNSTITIGSTSIALGGTSTTLVGITSVTATSFIGALTGNADTATTATNATNSAITDNTSSSATWYPTLVASTSGNQALTSSSTKLSFQPSTSTLSASIFSGAATNIYGGAVNRIPVQSAANTTTFIVAPSTASTVLSWSGSAFTWVGIGGATMVYPAAGIPNSTGTAWTTSYSTTGSGSVVALATSPVFVTPTLGVATATSLAATTITENTYAIVSQKDIGTNANQIPLNQYLGTMAWQDAKSVNIQGGTAVLTGGTATLTSLTVNGTAIPTNGIYLPATNSLGLSTNGVNRVYIDANGFIANNTGLAPNAWSSNTKAVYQFGDNGSGSLSFDNAGSQSIHLVNNMYQSASGVWTSTIGTPTTRYQLSNGIFNWYTGTSSGVGTTVTQNQSMQLSATGVLTIGYGASSGLVLNTPQASGGSAGITFQLIGNSASIIALREGGSFATSLIFNTAVSGGTITEAFRINSTQNLIAKATIATAGYTVATLPTGVVGMRAYVTNALSPSYGATVVGGGAVTIPVFYNGTNWICA